MRVHRGISLNYQIMSLLMGYYFSHNSLHYNDIFTVSKIVIFTIINSMMANYQRRIIIIIQILISTFYMFPLQGYVHNDENKFK